MKLASPNEGSSKALSEYEANALREIHEWKSPQLGWFGQAMKVINWPLQKAGDVILDTPGIGEVIDKSVGGFVRVCNDVAAWSVRPGAVFDEFRKAGLGEVKEPTDIFTLDLEEVDRVIGWLDMKYKGIALAEGAGTGAIGLPGIAPDVVALVTLNQRAIGEYATYCGFDVASQKERLFAMNMLGLASSPTDAAKGQAMAQLVRIARDVAKKRAWKELEKHAFVKLVQQIAKALGIRLTKAKLAQVVPGLGAAVGGGFNAYFTSKVCDAAFFLYRERFLAEKYGPDIIEVTVEPADDLDPGYPEEDEEIPGHGE